MEQMVKDHQAALKLARDTAKNARDPQLRAAAEKAVPEIRKHLEMARQVHAASKNAGTGASSFAR
jgi:putative membrane protein